jgi:hypothetical protein
MLTKTRNEMRKILFFATAALFCGLAGGCSPDGFDGYGDKVTSIGLQDAKFVSSPTEHMEFALTIGTPLQLKPMVLPTTAANKNVAYSNRHANLMEVTSEGLLTPKAIGTDTLTVSATDGSGVYTNFVIRITE